MTEQELKSIIQKSIQEAVVEARKTECGRCALCLDPDFGKKHEQHHKAMDDLLTLLSRINDTKWASIRAVFIVLVPGMVLAFLFFFFGIKQP